MSRQKALPLAEQESNPSQQAVPAPGTARADAARNVRVNAANFQRNLPLPSHADNGDEAEYSNHYASYSKGLPHDSFGEPQVTPYNELLTAVNSADSAQFEAITLGGVRRLVNPQAAYAYQLEGADSHALAIPPAPRFASLEAAGEIEELYWMALSRDVPFSDYTAPAPPAPIADSIQYLDAHMDFRGPKELGHVTAATLFRDTLPGSTQGPYVSQFLLLDVPYGAQTLEQRYRTRPAGDDHLFTTQAWLQIQNGQLPGPVAQELPPRYILTGRDLAEYVHRDFPLQSSLNAALIILGQNDDDSDPKSAPPAHDENNPYRPGGPYLKQEAFATLGNADVLDLIGRVMKLALLGQWFQKWQVHRRLRPEEFGGRVHYRKAGARPYPLHSELLQSPVLSQVFNRNSALNGGGEGTYLLNQAYPEGSPLHPSYGSGHSTYVGAGVTMLKAFFRTGLPVQNPVVPSTDGSTLLPYTGPTLTIGDELDKLAANIGVGRMFAGVHYRSDHEYAVRLGELIALRALQDLARTYNERDEGDFPGFQVRTFGGTTLTITATGPGLTNGVNAITSFTLINADTGQPVAGFDPILNGATLNRGSLPPNLNLRANATVEVDSVRFTYDGTSRIENEAPYALGGDSNGVYNSFDFTPGAHVLTATPFSGNGAGGLGGVPLTIRFTVT